jgi:hypothetical protein
MYRLRKDFHIIGLDLIVSHIKQGTVLEPDANLSHIFNFEGHDGKYVSIAVINNNPEYFEEAGK